MADVRCGRRPADRRPPRVLSSDARHAASVDRSVSVAPAQSVMLRIMGLFKALRGTDLTPDEEQAIKSLEATLPDGWRFKELRRQLVGRRPVKHETYGAVVKGPDR